MSQHDVVPRTAAIRDTIKSGARVFAGHAVDAAANVIANLSAEGVGVTGHNVASEAAPLRYRKNMRETVCFARLRPAR
eukprot:COSAG01_NODE_352_length_18424_cov_29.195034_11_plen_78_part_00